MLQKKNFDINLIILIFPIALLFRSFALNLYLVVSSLIFIFIFFNNKSVVKDLNLIICSFLTFYSYIILISIFSANEIQSIRSSTTQIRFFLTALLIFYLLNRNIGYIEKYIQFTKYVLLLFCFDLIFQFIFNVNIFGIEPGGNDPRRFSGAFGDELVAGTYIFFLSIPLIADIFKKFKSYNIKNKIFNIFFVIINSYTIILTGDRMATILFFTGLLILFLIFFTFKNFVKFFFFIFIFLTISFNLIPSVNDRYSKTFYELKNYKSFSYFRLFSSAVEISNDRKLFGVGLKNYRILCNDKIKNKYTNLPNLCSTHPHNNFFELLVETGYFGAILYFAFIYFVFKKSFRSVLFLKSTDDKLFGFAIGVLITLLLYVWPLKSSGSIFSSFYASFFWFNLGLMLSFKDKKTNKT